MKYKLEIIWQRFFYHAVQLGVRKGFNRQLINTIVEYAVEDFSWGYEEGLSEVEKEGLEIVLSTKINEESLQEELKDLTREEQLIFLDQNYGELLKNTLNEISPILDIFEDTDLSIVNKFKDFNTASQDVKEALRDLYPELTSIFWFNGW